MTDSAPIPIGDRPGTPGCDAETGIRRGMEKSTGFAAAVVPDPIAMVLA